MTARRPHCLRPREWRGLCPLARLRSMSGCRFPRGVATFVRPGGGRIEPTATPAAPATTNTVILRTTNPAQLMTSSYSAARDFVADPKRSSEQRADLVRSRSMSEQAEACKKKAAECERRSSARNILKRCISNWCSNGWRWLSKPSLSIGTAGNPTGGMTYSIFRAID